MSEWLRSYVYPGDHATWLAALWLVQSTGVIGLAWVLARFGARHRPAVRHGIWFWTLVSIVLTPVLAIGVDRAGLSLLDLADLHPGLALSAAEPPIEPGRRAAGVKLELLEQLLRGRVADEADGLPHDERAVNTEAPPRRDASVVRSQGDRVRAVLAGFFALWALGAAVLCSRLAVGWRLMQRLQAEGRPIDHVEFRDTLAKVGARLGAETLPRILASDRLDRPVATGFLRPAVIVPARMLDTKATDKLCDVLVHECAHLRRGDQFVGLLQRLVEAALWPQPLLPLLNRELTRAREEICDNHVLRGGDRLAYSWSLLEVTEAATAPTTLPNAFGLLSSPWRLEDRIAGLLDEKRDLMTNMNRRVSGLVMAVFLATSLGFAGLSFGLSAQAAANGETDELKPTDTPFSVTFTNQADAEASAPIPDSSKAVDQLVERLKQGPVERARQDEELGLYVLSIDEGKAALVTDEPTRGLRNCGSPHWSNDGRRILFDATPGRDWVRTRMQAIDLTGERLTVTDLGLGNCPNLSPDGKRIAFHLNPSAKPSLGVGVLIMTDLGKLEQSSGSTTLFARRATLFTPASDTPIGDANVGSKGVNLAPTRVDEFGVPKWSPYGRQLLITSFSSPVSQTLIDVESGRKRPLLVPGYRLWSFPSWAGDGTIVAVASDGDGTAIVLIDVTDPAEGKIKEVLWKKGDRLDATPSYPVYSPATGRCIFIGGDTKGKALYMVNRGKFGPPKRLEEAAGYDQNMAGLACSPDGRYLLFCSDRTAPKR